MFWILIFKLTGHRQKKISFYHNQLLQQQQHAKQYILIYCYSALESSVSIRRFISC